ncbi:MAG TPA: site-specific DNA-methyltransferase [Ktedonobacteraceae bacterium]|jgi:adenine-specific DNA-methyltransferase
MQKLTSDDTETRSLDILSENIAQIKKLFPEIFADGKVDFDILKQLLGSAIDKGEEKYGLNWHGKRRARQLALTPSTATLRPCPEDSVDWDITQNLMIEGDNLEVLKLLQKSYFSKVKLIYLDPPYNTGADVVYSDDYRDNIQNYLERTKQIDGEGRRLTSSTEASGRFHTDWLNMIYPRLKLARNLLRDDGVIFISIDDVEANNLKHICNEVFGENCFVEQIVWKNKYGSGALTRGFANVHEYILCYSKTPLANIAAPLDMETIAEYKHKDGKFATRGGYVTQPLATKSKDDRPNLRFPILWNGREIWPEKQWIWSRDRVERAMQNDEIVFSEVRGRVSVRMKQYLKDENGNLRKGKPVSILYGPFNQEGTAEVDSLLGEDVFSFPKPSALIRYFLSFVINDTEDKEYIVLDLFAGSGTTGHAVMAQNSADGFSRRYILVQLPEPLSSEEKNQSEAVTFCDRLDKPRNLAELTKERLRRAGEKIRTEKMFAGDTGFRVFKLDTSNIQAWDPDRTNLSHSLLSAVDHLKADRAEQDILFELLLKLGFDLTVPIEHKAIADKTVYSIGSGALLACLVERIGREEAEPLALGIAAWHKERSPVRECMVVFRDSAFADDVAKTNLAAILQQHGLNNMRSL